ncbi:hypothetical protein B0H10DRAFT_888008 [Mycena sp. CBHHK59/15]|nr:hypothetical protein B0H10DRAFT_888008 [Mycena sp. CBHHK59/15]
MLFSDFPPLSLALTLFLCLPSILVQARLSSRAQHIGRTIGRRDAVSDSGLASASWIWLPGSNLTSAPSGDVAFIKQFPTPAGKTASSAVIAMTVDNHFTLWVNGQAIGASGSGLMEWQSAQTLNAALNASANVFSVLAVNYPDDSGVPTPAGLLAAIRILYTDGSNETIISDSTWLASSTIPSDFPLPSDISQFVTVEVEAPYGSGPWATSVTLPTPDPDPLNLTGSAWIWPTADSSANASVGTFPFRKTLVTPSGKTAASATILVAVDNSFDLYINGQYVGSPPYDSNALNIISSWEYAQRFTVNLTASSNVFTVFAKNFAPQTPGGTSGAGLITALKVEYTDGSSNIFRSDTSWLTDSFTSVSAFLTAADSSLVPPISQGLFGMQPWGQIGISDALNAGSIPLNSVASAGSSSASGSAKQPSPATTSSLPAFTPINSPTTTNGVSSALDSHLVQLAVFLVLSTVVRSTL